MLLCTHIRHPSFPEGSTRDRGAPEENKCALSWQLPWGKGREDALCKRAAPLTTERTQKGSGERGLCLQCLTKHETMDLGLWPAKSALTYNPCPTAKPRHRAGCPRGTGATAGAVPVMLAHPSLRFPSSSRSAVQTHFLSHFRYYFLRSLITFL